MHGDQDDVMKRLEGRLLPFERRQWLLGPFVMLGVLVVVLGVIVVRLVW
ncbi:hypothetical protein [Salsipaludibacter albus]|nr:hypothetical protein [Salsipaludibacter albus]MBY5163365.1 hypothetical protein [Salsipaludibacter albus]